MSMQSLLGTGTRVWLDSIDPPLVALNRRRGVTGATSNPIIVADLIRTGRFDDHLSLLMEQGMSDSGVAWAMTDFMVREAQEAFHDDWELSGGDDGYVSFELDPLLETGPLGHAQRVRRYIDLGVHWSMGHANRMIKVPATAAGLDALEDLAAAGVPLNVTLMFTRRQYERARDAIWRGAQRRGRYDRFKSVYSIFVSRVDVYTARHAKLSPAAQGLVGIVNARRLWRLNQQFWADKDLPLKQQIVFASTGTKDPAEPADKYVAALAGGDIQTNPPTTNDAVESREAPYQPMLEHDEPREVLEEIDAAIDVEHMERTLMEEGLEKFGKPQRELLELVGSKRAAMVAGAG